jgi:hypothetical protein
LEVGGWKLELRSFRFQVSGFWNHESSIEYQNLNSRILLLRIPFIATGNHPNSVRNPFIPTGITRILQEFTSFQLESLEFCRNSLHSNWKSPISAGIPFNPTGITRILQEFPSFQLEKSDFCRNSLHSNWKGPISARNPFNSNWLCPKSNWRE